jgi:hypothetical protein
MLMRFLKSDDSTSVAALIAANLIPLGGVLFAGWDVGLIVLLYWTENIILGFYNILKMATLHAHKLSPHHLAKLFFIPFFCIHYGGFCAGHGFFIIALFDIGNGFDSILNNSSWPGPFVFLQMLLSVIIHLTETLPKEMLLSVLALFISHGISFVQNYIMKKEYTQTSLDELMKNPYKRIVILHVAIIGGAFFILALNSPLPLLIIIILLKISLDIYLHNKEHKSIALEKSWFFRTKEKKS